MAQTFDQEFRDNAVKMALERKIPIKQLAEDLGIGKSTLTRWIAMYRKGGRITSGESPEQKEIRRLKRSLEVITEERDILKKAMAIFSCPKKRGSLL
jgi:transposase